MQGSRPRSPERCWATPSGRSRSTSPARAALRACHFSPQKEFFMNTPMIWGLQVLLALAFGAAGVMKMVMPVDQLVANGMAWTAALPPAAVTLLGVAEVLGAVGL